jgi:hypothetical protein
MTVPQGPSCLAEDEHTLACRIDSFLFGVQNRTFGRHVAAIKRILISETLVLLPAGGVGSLKWCIESYGERGIVFDEIWGWEARSYDPEEYWKAYPEVRCTVCPRSGGAMNCPPILK